MARAKRSYQRPFQTKRGVYGTLYRFRIRYRDRHDQGSPDFDWFAWAYSEEHAEEKFDDSDDEGGWKILSVEKMREST